MHICAVTVPENKSSIKLLNKLGLSFEKETTVENETLHVYKVSTAKLLNKRRMMLCHAMFMAKLVSGWLALCGIVG